MDARKSREPLNSSIRLRMNVFRPFEEKALRLLCTAALGEAALDGICTGSELVGYSHSRVGYFLTVRHALLPAACVVLLTCPQ